MITPYDKGVSANKASKISRILGYEEGTIHRVKSNQYHPGINHDDFVRLYEELTTRMQPILTSEGKICVIFN